MAKRDHKAETARRNEIAREKGYASRAAQRYAESKAKKTPAKPARKRDYKAEEKRRNARAKTLGFTSRGQQRRALAKRELTVAEYKKMVYECVEWSRVFARSAVATYTPQGANAKDRATYAKYGWPEPKSAANLGVSVAQYTVAYHACFVAGAYKDGRNNKSGGNEDMFYWFVELNDYQQVDEYESRYGRASWI